MPNPLKASLSDAILVDQSLRGRSEAFEALVFRYQSKGLAVALAQGVAPSSIEDVVQEAFLQAFRSLAQLTQKKAFGPWFLSIVRNLSKKQFRGSDRITFSAVVEEQSEHEPNTLEARELHEKVWDEVSKLPESVREAIFLYYYEGESTRSVAKTLGTNISGVKNRLRTGRELLRHRLWRVLGDSIKTMIPSAEKKRKSARRLSLVLFTTLGSSSASALATETTPFVSSAASISAAQTTGAFVMAKKLSTVVLVCVFLFTAGYLGGDLLKTQPRPETLSSSSTNSGGFGYRSTPSIESQPETFTPQKSGEKTEVESEQTPPVASSQLSATEGRVIIKVINDSTNKPFVDVGVKLVPRNRPSPNWSTYFVYTDEEGQAIFENVSVGRYFGGFDRANPRGRFTSIEVLPGETTEISLRFPDGIRIHGQVVNKAGAPIPEAEILVSLDEFDAFSARVLTLSDADGKFEIEGVQSGRYLSARKAGYSPSSQKAFSSRRGSTEELRLVLPGLGGAVEGYVFDRERQAIAGALVMIGDRDLHHGAYSVKAAPIIVKTNKEGFFNAEGVPTGELPIVVRAPSFAPQEEKVQVIANRTSELEVTLDSGVTVEGLVLSSEGSPVSRTELVVGSEHHFARGTDPLVTKTRSDSEGRYRLQGLIPGKIEIHASRDGQGKSLTFIEAENGEIVQLDIELAPPLELKGKITFEDGTPVQGAGIQSVGLYYVETDDDGRFRIKDCDDKEYEVTVTERGKGDLPCAIVKLQPGEEEHKIVVKESDRANCIVKGKVVDASGSSLRSATVRLSPVGTYRQVRAKSGFFGGFRTQEIPSGEYQVIIEAKGYPKTFLENVQVKPNQTTDLGKLQFPEPGWLKVEFINNPEDHEGLYFGIFDPKDRCSVAASLSSDPHRKETLTPGKHRVVLKKKWGEDDLLSLDFEIVAGQETVVKLDALRGEGQ